MAKNTEFNRFRTEIWLITHNLAGSELRMKLKEHNGGLTTTFNCIENSRIPNSDVAKNTEFNRFRTQMWLKTHNLTGSELRMQLNEHKCGLTTIFNCI